MVDLSALRGNPAALQVILLARGQLNLAFRSRGAFPPDPLPVTRMSGLSTDQVDDPAALGPVVASLRHRHAFERWSARMPAELVSPVLAILARTLGALKALPEGEAAARRPVEEACDYLLAQLPRPPGFPAASGSASS